MNNSQRKPLNPDTLTADDVFAAAERCGVKVDDRDDIGWYSPDANGAKCGCPMMVLAIDCDPTLPARYEADECELGTPVIAEITGLPADFIEGAVEGFDYGSWGSCDADTTWSFKDGYRLGQQCLKRIRPKLFAGAEVGS